ncbi:MAG TPA: 50S ribosomal protein L11 methyltransferase [Ignavibacteriaceae bacterium]|nr:50S ribosomal protein L11 methyltransferase [Ignavibacteriaceae bacterium]
MKNYKVFTITSEPFLLDILSSLMWELQISGLTEEDDCLKVFSGSGNEVNETKISDMLEKLVAEKLIKSFSIKKEILEDKNWNELWEKGREIIRATQRIIIKPTFKNYSPKENEIVLTIDPKMLFGTGEHQTTKLVLSFLEKYIKPGYKILDVGSGTGLLAIASVKLGAKRAVALNADETCLNNCEENCSLNNVTDSVHIFTGEIGSLEENSFDLILANIQKNVLFEIAESIKQKTSAGGLVILSGLFREDEKFILDRFTQIGFQKVDFAKMDEWIALVFRSV